MKPIVIDLTCKSFNCLTINLLHDTDTDDIQDEEDCVIKDKGKDGKRLIIDMSYDTDSEDIQHEEDNVMKGKRKDGKWSFNDIKNINWEKTKRKRRYNRKRFHQNKTQKKRYRCSEVVNLLLSSPGLRREGSTCVHMGKSTFVNIGHQIRNYFRRTNISRVKFLDIGHGHGCGLIDLSYVFGMTPVGIECDTLMYQGSVVHLKNYIKQMPEDQICLPYIPLKADALTLCAFGGAEVVYSWCNGAPVILMDKIYQTFIKDSTCKILITSEFYPNVDLKRDKLKRVQQVKGVFHGSSMELYFYAKYETHSKFMEINSNDATNAKIRESFKKASQFKNMHRSMKSKEYVEMIIDWANNV